MIEKQCQCELDGFQGGVTAQNCPIHKEEDINDLLDTHFEEQRIHDLKIDIDAVLQEVQSRMKKARGVEYGELTELWGRLISFKEIL